jgi:transposase InsO family protein
MANAICVERTSYYRKPTTQKVRDEKACEQLEAAHTDNQFYGVRRLCIQLGWSQNKTRRIRLLSGVTAATYRHSNTRQSSPTAEIAAPANALKEYVRFITPDRPQAGQTYAPMATLSGAWVQDFTHVRCGQQWYYLAVIIELASRRVVGWSVGAAHDTSLTLSALRLALQKHTPPPILHSDQGSEYLSYAHRDLCEEKGIVLSCSTKSSPWQNGFMESFFGKFKPELGNPARYNTPETLYEMVAKNIYHYNHTRIHTTLKMSPAAYAARLKEQREMNRIEGKGRDKVLQEMGA